MQVSESLPASGLLERSSRSLTSPSQKHLAQSRTWHEFTAYDASYLHFAIRDSAPLATVDVDLRRAAAEAGVALIG